MDITLAPLERVLKATQYGHAVDQAHGRRMHTV